MGSTPQGLSGESEEVLKVISHVKGRQIKHLVCDEPECKRKIKLTSWESVKSLGWFYSPGGRVSYCPDHELAFLNDWRK